MWRRLRSAARTGQPGEEELASFSFVRQNKQFTDAGVLTLTSIVQATRNPPLSVLIDAKCFIWLRSQIPGIILAVSWFYGFSFCGTE
jgi:hypothetical protein